MYSKSGTLSPFCEIICKGVTLEQGSTSICCQASISLRDVPLSTHMVIAVVFVVSF